MGPRDPPRICALRGSACCTPEAGIPSRCAGTTRTMQRITFPSSALRRASSLTRACLCAIRTGLSTLLDMGRYTGVGMPRPKKAKPAPAPAPPPAPPTPAQPPDPPPTPPKLTRIVAPESPSRTLLLRAQRLARITAKKKAAESRKLLTEHQQAYEVAGRLFDSKLKRIETESHTKNPSRKFSAARAAARIDKATAELSEARYTLLGCGAAGVRGGWRSSACAECLQGRKNCEAAPTAESGPAHAAEEASVSLSLSLSKPSRPAFLATL